MLEIKNLGKRYMGKKALEGVDLTIAPGEFVGLFGENGAGKTTLMKSVPGLLAHTGDVLLDGEPVTHRNIDRLSFATAEHSFFPQLSPQAHMEFYAAHFPRFSQKRFDGLMEFFALPRHRPVGKFSTGQKNQFEVILAVSQGADYILMDEPFAGNDVFNREDFYKVLLGILEPRETVLLSTHLIEEVAPFVSRAVLLHQGRILADESTESLEERGETLMGFVKSSFGYRADRASRALGEIMGEDERK